MAQPWAKSFYHSKAWLRVRAFALERDYYLCQICGRPAEEVHHKIKLTPDNINDPVVALNPDCLVSLCHDCHSGQHGADNPGDCVEGFQFDEKGQLTPLPPSSIHKLPYGAPRQANAVTD